VAGVTKRLQIPIFIGAAVSFRDNVVDRFRWAWSAVAQALLADVTITLKDAGADNVPLAAVATLMAAQSSLVLLPPFVTVRIAVAGTICGGARAPALTTGARDSCRHIVGSNKKAPRERGCGLFPIGYIFDLSPVAITMGLPMVIAIKNRPEAAVFFNLILEIRSQLFARAKPNIKATSGINAHVASGNQNCMNDPMVMSK